MNTSAAKPTNHSSTPVRVAPNLKAPSRRAVLGSPPTLCVLLALALGATGCDRRVDYSQSVPKQSARDEYANNPTPLPLADAGVPEEATRAALRDPTVPVVLETGPAPGVLEADGGTATPRGAAK